MDNFEDKYENKNPFSVPDSYFDNFTDRMMSKIETPEQPEKKKLIRMLKPYFGLVAIFLISLFVVQVVFPLFVEKDQLLVKKGTIAQRADNEMDEEIFYNDFNPTSEEIIEYLASEVDAYELYYADLY